MHRHWRDLNGKTHGCENDLTEIKSGVRYQDEGLSSAFFFMWWPPLSPHGALNNTYKTMARCWDNVVMPARCHAGVGPLPDGVGESSVVSIHPRNLIPAMARLQAEVVEPAAGAPEKAAAAAVVPRISKQQ